jgi:enoyl-[acyl-carrier protein] reductase / trans-2-enoyl-CoA reductase (NAD+)
MSLEVFRKLPLGGLDRRALANSLAERGRSAAVELLARERAGLRARGTRFAEDAAVLVLGGSNGITRALAIQLLFAERVPVYGVHFDSEKLQIGFFHVQALTEAAASAGLTCRYWNEDATKPATVEAVAGELSSRHRAVHLVNGIAAGATKRYAEHGPTRVKDLDVAFHPVLQVPDFSRPENIRKLGLVDVEVASDADVERTNRFMGTSSLLWAEALAGAGLIRRDESIVAFCDYDYPSNDPVYAMGPLAGAKRLQREGLLEIRRRFGARTARLCYPAMPTTALGAIPGGLLMYAVTAEILKERGQYQDLAELAGQSMAIFTPSWEGQELRLDAAYQACLPEFFARSEKLEPKDLPAAFSLLFEASQDREPAARA